MNAYADRVTALAQSTSESVQALYDRYLAGELTEELFVELATTALTVNDHRAATLADVGVAAILTAQLGAVALPVGVPAPDPPKLLLHNLIREALDDPDPRTKLDTAARGRTLETARECYASGLRRHEVKFWKRVPNSGACPACRNLAGTVLPIETPMWHHTGCSCTQAPATPTEKENSDAQRSAAARRAAATRRANRDRARDARDTGTRRADRERTDAGA
ncbi:hypothetical protein [Gordonia sp. WA4-43]|uniref:hypothetical protein n=1 Tax=Gordonia sp. WA4-43 TaxID=2878678 RepID=UPI001CF955E3|nr:hypothetical protein [Gordonia sp. WA4-43]UCZ91318.1 hypothetical protein LEL84_06575 [Gordonia sp. WA4-43]